MNILFTINNKYVQHIKIEMLSIFSSCDNYSEITFYFIYSDISIKNRDNLRKFANKFHSKVVFVPINNTLIEQLPINGQNWSREIYYRLFAAYLLNDVDRVLYLDGDILVNDSLKYLWEYNLENATLGAVANDIQDTHLSRLNMNNDSVYFNSGMLLMNLKRWRELYPLNILEEKLIEYKNLIKFPDQDFINLFMINDICEISNCYNYMISVAEINEKYPKLNNFTICHYVMEKPWNIKFPYKTDWLYFKYLKKAGRWIQSIYLWAMHRAYRIYKKVFVLSRNGRI